MNAVLNIGESDLPHHGLRIAMHKKAVDSLMQTLVAILSLRVPNSRNAPIRLQRFEYTKLLSYPDSELFFANRVIDPREL